MNHPSWMRKTNQTAAKFIWFSVIVPAVPFPWTLWTYFLKVQLIKTFPLEFLSLMLVKVVGFLSVHLFVLVRHCAIEKSHSRGRSREKKKSEIYLWPIENHCSHCLWLCSQTICSGSPPFLTFFSLFFFAKKVNRSVGASDVIVGSEHIHKQSDYCAHNRAMEEWWTSTAKRREKGQQQPQKWGETRPKTRWDFWHFFIPFVRGWQTNLLGDVDSHNSTMWNEWLPPDQSNSSFYLYRSTFFSRLHVSLLFFSTFSFGIWFTTFE